MANGITTAFWGMVINNYDDNDLVLVQNGYPDHMREIIHTLEKGEQGTPHIQAWIKLQRQQRLSFVKKLFPRGNFKPLTSDEYLANAKRYAQKLDETADSMAVHKFNDPYNTIESVIKKVITRIIEEGLPDWRRLSDARIRHQKIMVQEDYKFAKIFVSSTYKTMWNDYGLDMYVCLCRVHDQQKLADTHTHTHTDELISRGGGITTNDAEDSEVSSHHSEELESLGSAVYEDLDDDCSEQESDDSSEDGSSTSGRSSD